MNKRNNGRRLTHALCLMCMVGAVHPACANEALDAKISGNDTAVKKLLTQALLAQQSA